MVIICIGLYSCMLNQLMGNPSDLLLGDYGVVFIQKFRGGRCVRRCLSQLPILNGVQGTTRNVVIEVTVYQ
jgi:hypothetical protein